MVPNKVDVCNIVIQILDFNYNVLEYAKQNLYFQFAGGHWKGIQERSKIYYGGLIFIGNKRSTGKGKRAGIISKGMYKYHNLLLLLLE